MKPDNKYALIRADHILNEIKSLVKKNRKRFENKGDVRFFFQEDRIMSHFIDKYAGNNVGGNRDLLLMPRNWKDLLNDGYNLKKIRTAINKKQSGNEQEQKAN